MPRLGYFVNCRERIISGAWALYLSLGTCYEVNIHKYRVYTLLRLGDSATCTCRRSSYYEA